MIFILVEHLVIRANYIFKPMTEDLKKRMKPDFHHFGDFEDVAVLFFDADHDGDLDLFICPGGNNNPP